MIEPRVLICAFRKPAMLRDRTLAWLGKCKWPSARTLILVPDESDLELHSKIIGREWSESLRVTRAGLVASREYAEWNLVELGGPVIWINDDVDGCIIKIGNNSQPVTLQTLSSDGFELCEKTGAKLWGIYPIANPYFMKPKVRTDLRHIVGCLYGSFVRRDARLKIQHGDAKEDYERSLRTFRLDGRTVRMDYFAPLTTYYNRERYEPPGGRFASRTREAVEMNIRALEREFPGQVRRNDKRQSNFPEILLNRFLQRPAITEQVKV